MGRQKGSKNKVKELPSTAEALAEIKKEIPAEMDKKEELPTIPTGVG